MGFVDQFELIATRVYSSLCHLTGGDNRAADELLIATYRSAPGGAGAVMPEWLTLAAHHLALGQALAANPSDELAFWANLSAPQRVAIHLRLVERFPVAAIANGFGLTEADVSTLIAQGLRQCPAATTGSDLVRWLRPTEAWLGDEVRNQLRPPGGQAAKPSPVAPHRSKPRTLVIVATVAALAMLVGIFALQRNKSSDGKTSAPLVTQLTTPETTAGTASETTAQPAFSEIISLANTIRFPGGSPGNVTVFTNVNLPDRQLVIPDAIVQYPERKVGLIWTSPCNRPANFVTLSKFPEGLGLQLFTGAIDIRSCTGMPTRWTAVLQMQREPGTPVIVPVSDEGVLDLEYPNSYGSADAPPSSTPNAVDARSYAALVDADEQPWYYGTGCVTPSVVRYESPTGPIFETVTDAPNQSIGSTSEELTCLALAKRPVLLSTSLAFPRLFGHSSDRVQCGGPAGSFRDLYNVGDDGVDKPTSNWTSWDGCLIRGDVITETELAQTCARPGTRALTVNIGGATAVYINVGNSTFPDAQLDPVRPADAYDTGLAHNNEELWLSPSHPELAYIVDGQEVVAWPAVGLNCQPVS